MEITEQNKDKYKRLLDARKAGIIEAALRYHEAVRLIDTKKVEIETAMAEVKTLQCQATTEMEKRLAAEKERAVSEKNDLISGQLETLTLALAKYKAQIEAFNQLTKGNQIQQMFTQVRLLEAAFKPTDSSLSLATVITALNKEHSISSQRYDMQTRLLNAFLVCVAITGYVVGIMVSPWFFLFIAAAVLAKLCASCCSVDKYDCIENNRTVFPAQDLEQMFKLGDAAPAAKQFASEKGLTSTFGIHRPPPSVDPAVDETVKSALETGL